MYWKQGWDHLSSIEEGKYKVDAKCVMGMKKMHDNTNFTLKLVTDANIDDYAPTSASLMKNETLSIIRASLWSDLVRIELLYRHGGIWADTSVYALWYRSAMLLTNIWIPTRDMNMNHFLLLQFAIYQLIFNKMCPFVTSQTQWVLNSDLHQLGLWQYHPRAIH